jgi:hypothetical protein
MIMRVSISVRDNPNKFDLTVSADVPDIADSAVRSIVRSVALAKGPPDAQTGLLARLLSDLLVSWRRTNCIVISDEVVYDGYIVTINVAERRIFVQGSANSGAAEYIDFADLDTYCAGD